MRSQLPGPTMLSAFAQCSSECEICTCEHFPLKRGLISAVLYALALLAFQLSSCGMQTLPWSQEHSCSD